MDAIWSLTEGDNFGVLLVATLLIISFLFTLYAIALVNRRLRLMQESLNQVVEDNKLINESLRFLQGQGRSNQPPKAS